MGRFFNICHISLYHPFQFLPFLPGTNHRWYLPFAIWLMFTPILCTFVHLLDRGCVGVDDIAVDSHFSKIGAHVSVLTESSFGGSASFLWSNTNNIWMFLFLFDMSIFLLLYVIRFWGAWSFQFRAGFPNCHFAECIYTSCPCCCSTPLYVK